MTAPPAATPPDRDAADPTLRWRLPAGQRLVFEDFDDGIVMFDALVGSTHLMSVTAAEALAAITDSPGLTSAELYHALLARTGIRADALALDDVVELLQQLENLDLVTAAR